MNSATYLKNNLKNFPNEPALSIKGSSGEWETDNWSTFHESVIEVSKSLLACGINSQDKISIYSYNRKEWHYCYSAAQYINAVGVGVYHTCSSNEVDWIVSNSESKIVLLFSILFHSL